MKVNQTFGNNVIQGIFGCINSLALKNDCEPHMHIALVITL